MNTVLDMLNQIIGGLLIAGIVWFAIKFVVERERKQPWKKKLYVLS